MLGAVTVVQGAAILAFPGSFIAPIFSRAGEAGALGWVLAAIPTLVYVAYSVRGLKLQPYLGNVSAFKLLGPVMAVPTGILEEIFFRKYPMDILAHAGQGAIVQIVASAALFGILHALWGIRGGARAFFNAIGSTAFLGAMLSVVYLGSNRVILPCIVAHFALNVVLEPWLVYAYILRARSRGTTITASD